MSAPAPLAGLRVVEVALGVSAVGAGMAASLPGALLRDLGADVARVQSARRSTLDAGIEFERAWNRGKEIVEVDDEAAGAPVAALASEADVVVVTGPEAVIERDGSGSRDLARANPRLVVVRIRPSFNAEGPLPDLELLVAARAGVPTQIRSHHGDPAFPDLQIAGAGAALAATVGALAILYERETTGVGGWAETSLYDGLLAILPMIVGRVEHPSATTNLLWRDQGPAEALSYRCADGGYVQLWFGAKGAYEGFLAHVGDAPSEQGYNADLVSGAMVERGTRWADMFATREPGVLARRPGGSRLPLRAGVAPWRSAARRARVREVGLAVEHDGITVLGPRCTSRGWGSGAPTHNGGARLLDGVRVLDLSAYLAGPITPLVLAELGADVVKVEPVTGDVHRNMDPMFAAGQRGKRAVALDLKAPDAPPRARAAVPRQRRGAPQRARRAGRATRLRRGHGAGGESRRGVQLRQRVRRDRAPRAAADERPAHAGAVGHRSGAGGRRAATDLPRVGRGRRDQRLAVGVRRARGPLRAPTARWRAVGAQQPPRRRAHVEVGRVPRRRRHHERSGARRRAARVRRRVSAVPGRRPRVVRARGARRRELGTTAPL